MQLALFYIPCPDEVIAKEIGDALLQQKIIACAHVFPVQSAYTWQGQLQSEGEFILLLKTLPECIEAVNAIVSSLHPYEIPAILYWLTAINDSYAKWMRQVVMITGAE